MSFINDNISIETSDVSPHALTSDQIKQLQNQTSKILLKFLTHNPKGMGDLVFAMYMVKETLQNLPLK